MDDLKELRLTITVDTLKRIIAERDNGAKYIGEVSGFDWNSLGRRTIDLFVRWLKRGDVFTTLDDLKLFGEYLYDILFTGKIDEALNKALDDIGDQGLLRLDLDLQELPELARLPWEYLYHRDKECFLCKKTKLVLSRYLSSPRPEDTLKCENLKILIVYAKPSDLGATLAECAAETIEEYAKELNAKFQDELKLQRDSKFVVNIHLVENATFVNFSDAIGTKPPPDVVHFIGHGKFDRGDLKGKIAFVGRDGKADWRDDTEFVDCFEPDERPPPRLVFLHMCEGAVVDLYEGLNGFVPKLLNNARVPAVVGMQYPIDARPALDFCIAFYRELLISSHVGLAVQEGRRAAERACKLDKTKTFLREFGVPVLYMRSKEGVLLKLRKDKSSEIPRQASKPQEAPPQSPSSEGKPDMGNDNLFDYSKQPTSDLRVEVQPRLETAEHTLQAAIKPTEIRNGKPVIRYFVSYAHDDKDLKKALLEDLEKQLAIAKDYCFKAWDDGEILPGEDWHEHIQAALKRCQFGLLLVSPAFLCSNYIQDQELRVFVPSNLGNLEYPEHKEKWAIPIALKRILFDGSMDLKGLKRLQVFHDSNEKSFYDLDSDNTRYNFALELFQQICKIAKCYGTFVPKQLSQIPPQSPTIGQVGGDAKEVAGRNGDQDLNAKREAP